jgi:diaminopimelate decarboxylase
MKARSGQAADPRRVEMVDPASYTPYFSHRLVGPGRGRTLYCDGVALERIADRVGTPAYVYSRRSMEDAFRGLDRAFRRLPHKICYAVKANANLAVLRVFASLGSSFDIVSGGELDRLRRVGVPGDRIVFSGVGKTREEIREAIRYPNTRGRSARRGGILLFNVESEAELGVLVDEAARHVRAGGEPARAAVRVNPDILAGGHPHISTGYHKHKFGMDWPHALGVYLAHKDSRWIVWGGISTHIGSQIVALEPFRSASMRLASYVRELAANGIHLEYVDIGGGVGIRYRNETPIEPGAYAQALSGSLRPLGRRLLLEPGRMLAGPAGVLLTRVLYTKTNGSKHFVIVDAAMNDLVRPSMYGATHAITKASAPQGRPQAELVDVVGPVCESGDFLARNWPLPAARRGDLLVVWAAGAYGFALSANYNARRRPPEVLVEGGQFRIIRRRQTYDDLVRGE